MIGKVVQLLEKEFEYGFKVVYGIHSLVCKNSFRYMLNFAEIQYSNLSPGSTRTYISKGYIVEDGEGDFKRITVCNGYLKPEDKEEYLLVCIPKADDLNTTAKIIAGRNKRSAILEMRAGDKVELTRFSDRSKNRFVYIAVEAENEMFLIEKTR